MKRIKYLFATLILSGILFSSCEDKRTRDYSLFPQGTVLSGNMKKSKTFYLIREDSLKMGGICFIDNNRAVAEIISFSADSTGVVTFIYGNNTYWGKMRVNPSSMKMTLTLPKISDLAIGKQTISLTYFSQILKCVDCPEHYKNSIFTNIAATKDIQYGTARGYYTSKAINTDSKYRDIAKEAVQTKLGVMVKSQKDIPLDLDIYYPEKDNIKKSPLLLFIHGGAFIFGDKESDIQQAITNYLVKRGYIVASINYRLGSLGTESIERTYYRNVQDARAALRYLVNEKEKYKIDDEQIYIAGNSAGGIIALTTAFLDSAEIHSSIGNGKLRLREDLGGLDDSGNDLKNSFKIAGVVSMWGAVSNLEILDNRIPTLLFHGTEDNIVPCGIGTPLKNIKGVFQGLASKYFTMYGSEPIYNHLKSKNIPAKYIPFTGCNHEPQSEPDGTLNTNMDTICKETGNFLFENVSKHYFNYKLSGNTTVKKYDSTPIYILDNIQNASVQWQVDGGLITKQTNGAIRIIWYNPNITGTVTACINNNGVSCRIELKVRIIT